MTDEQILIELARVMGWKIAPKENREAWFDDQANFPCLDGYWLRPAWDQVGRVWNPFTDWTDAMGLAEKWMDSEAGDWYDLERLPVHGYHVYLFPSDDGPGSYSAIDQSGPRAVCMAIAKALGIEVEG